MANLSNINGKFVVEQTTGYVGVGTTDPSYPIEVLNASAEIALNASGASIYRLKSDSTDYFRINKNGVGDKLVISGGGDVGIGISVPTTKLHIGGTAPGDSIIRQDSTVSGTNWEIGERTAGKWQIFEDDGDSIVATFMSSGNVGIGTTGPTEKLDVSGTAIVRSTLFTVGNVHGFTSTYGASFFINNGGGTTYFNATGGNVGIGTVSPNTKLHISSAALSDIRLENTGTAIGSGENYGQIEWEGNDYNTSANGIRASIQVKGYGAGTQGETGMYFRTSYIGADSNVDRMVISHLGNVGIGTASPNKELTLGGAAGTQTLSFTTSAYLGDQAVIGNIEFSTHNADASYAQLANIYALKTGTNTNSGDITFWTKSNGARSEKMRIKNNGVVYIGYVDATAIGSHKLEVNGALYASGNIRTNGIFSNNSAPDDDVFEAIQSGRKCSLKTYFSSGSTESRWVLKTSTGATDGSTVDALTVKPTYAIFNGGVGIGATSTPYKLRVKTDATHTNGVYMSAGTGNGNHSLYVEDRDGTAEYFAVRGDGQIRLHASRVGDTLFGCTALPSASVFGSAFKSDSKSRYTLMQSCNDTGLSDLQEFFNPNGAVGKIQTSGSATIFNTASDYRLKEDLQDFAGLDIISKIPVYDFKWKIDGKRSYGVMAHELQEILPDAAAGKKDAINEDGSINPQGVDYSKIVPLLVKSIQELKAEIEILKNK